MCKSKKVCIHCGRPSCRRYYKGICEACCTYRRTNGVLPPLDRIYMRNKGKVCKRCKDRMADRKGLCKPCYSYQLTNKKPRPKRLFTDHCLVCGRPKAGQFFGGRCATCRQYLYRHGVERPQELIDKHAPNGWCDCGQPATHTDVELTIMTGTGFDIAEKYNLCQDCYNLEFDDIQTKGEAVWNR